MSASDPVVIVGMARTPMGGLLGELSSFSANELGAHAIKGAMKEAGIAVLIEAQLTKPQILELYLNRVYLSAGVYGVETMSEHLFRKQARAVTLPEAALIAGLIRAPSALSPWSNLDGALDRSRVVLQRMQEEGYITAACMPEPHILLMVVA